MASMPHVPICRSATVPDQSGRRVAKRLKKVRDAAMAVAVLGAATCALGAPTASAATQSSPALFGRTTLNYASTLSTSAEAQRYGVMVLQATDASDVAALHAANPSLKILMDSNALYSRTNDPSGVGTCTSEKTDASSEPDWYLTDQHGQRISTSSGSLMNMGSASYQQSCVSHAIALAKQDGFNGIMFDGLSAQYTSLVPAGTQIEKYSSNSSWDNAMQSFLNYAGSTVQDSGLMVEAQMYGTSPTMWQQWTAPLNGSELPGWTDGGKGTTQQIPYWTSKLSEVAWSESHGKQTLLDSYNRTEAGNTYGLASMLLVANGNTDYATNNADDGSYEAWYSEYAQAQKLGAPLGTYTVLTNGEYERKFQNGIVLVNPTASQQSKVALNSTYSDGSSTTSSAQLAPATGEILINASQGTSPALFNRTAYAYKSSLTDAQEAARYQFIILTSLDASKVAALHAANPKLKILLYSMALYSNSSDATGNSTCTSYTSDNANDPSWFLLDQNGNRMHAANGGTGYAMDLGNSGYQQACVAHTVAQAKQDGFDGVFFDGINKTWQGFVPSSSTVVKYPTNADWQAAMQSFLNYAGKTIQADGLMAFANLGADGTLWDQWTAPLSGSQQQGFTDGGDGLTQQLPYWSTKLGDIAWSEAHDKYAIEDSYNKTEAGNTFGLASMLLVANGYSSWSTSNTDDTANYEQWYQEYSDAQQLGSPTGAYTQLSNGVYERTFQNGIVLVNPTGKSVSTFSLGATYQGATTPSTSTVSMAAASGLILLDS